MITVGSKAVLRKRADTPATRPPDKAGFSTGVNLSAGCEDDGWTVPPPVTLRDGTRLQLQKDGEALHAAFKAIESAQRRVCVEMYIFGDDATGMAFARLLAEKARQGVHVFVIYDCFASRRYLGFGDETPTLTTMRQAGVRLQVFHPMRPWECKFAWHPGHRNHRKLFVVDDHLAGTGGLNIANEYAGAWIVPGSTGEFWRDNGIGINGPGAKVFLGAFRTTWNYLNRGGRLRKLAYAQHLHDDAELGVFASSPTLDSGFLPFYRSLLRSAQTSITLTMAYFAPDDLLVKLLCDAARRGVRVRLMLPGISDVPLVRIAGHAFFELLLDAGAEIYERQYVVLHAKTMCVDGCTTIIGSANLDYRSIELNSELSAIVRSPAFGQQIEDLFENDKQYAKRITKAEWRRRPVWDRVVQWGVSRARYLL